MEKQREPTSRVAQILERVTKLDASERVLLKGLSSRRARSASNAELAADLLILPSAVERSAQRLEEQGFVVIEVSPPKRQAENSYIQKIKLTESGEDAISLLPLVEKEE
jgi:DNA-binding MarR family transcriptional regulator